VRILPPTTRLSTVERGTSRVGASISERDAIRTRPTGALAQQRLLALSPRRVAADDLAKLFEASMVIW
jgi:hypothetical protein